MSKLLFENDRYAVYRHAAAVTLNDCEEDGGNFIGVESLDSNFLVVNKSDMVVEAMDPTYSKALATAEHLNFLMETEAWTASNMYGEPDKLAGLAKKVGINPGGTH